MNLSASRAYWWETKQVDGMRDEDLLADHVAGRADAFEWLVARYAEDLFGFFQRFVGSASQADDLVQETFLQVHLSAGSFDPERKFKPWLYTIASNKARDFMRSRRRRATHSLDGLPGDPDRPVPGVLLEADQPTAAEHVASQEQREQVRELVAVMPEHQRAVLILGYFQKLPYAEIAEVLQIPVGTVKSRLHAAVNHFAKLWLARTGAADSDS